MNNASVNRIKNYPFYNMANILALAAIAIYAVFNCIEFAALGVVGKLWITLPGCAVACIIVMALRNASGVLNPAFASPFSIYLLYVTGSLISGRFTGSFMVFLCICAMAMMYFNPWRFLFFIIAANSISLVLILAGVQISIGKNITPAGQLVDWAFACFASLFMFSVIQFVSNKIKESNRARDSFETLLSSIPDYVVLVDELCRVTYISKPLAKFAHIENDRMAEGRPLLDIFQDMAVKLKTAEILDSSGLYEGKWELMQKGELRHFRIISDRLLGESPGLFIILNDVTSLEKARFEAEEAGRAKSAFLANTSHEIRTPMNAILGMAELILRKDVPSDVYDDVTNIKHAGTSLLTIVNDILDFSKIESGKIDIASDEYNFASLINDVISIIRMRFEEKEIDFITKIDGSLPSLLMGDEIRVRQVMINLLSNAVKYTKKGDICLSIYAAEKPEASKADGILPGIVLVFEVADTGIGIKRENIEKLFIEFEQFNTRTSRGVEGTGLGLAISRNLCRLMGGDITVQSIYGKGSVFKAVIPQQVKDTTPFARVNDVETKTLLVYEGREKHADALVYTTEKLGVQCIMVPNQEELLKLLRENHFHYALVSYPLFDEAQKIIKTLSPLTEIAILHDFNRTDLPPGLYALAMPVHPLTLARFLNDDHDTGFGHAGDFSKIDFTAPEARILIVDDIATNLKVAEGLLEPYQAAIDTALSGTEAIRFVGERSYDIIFMDHMMPEMDGVETTAFIRNMEKEKSRKSNTVLRTPIVALTANAISGMKEMFFEKGFDDFLPKPIEMKKLDEIMWRWIPEHKHILTPRTQQNGNPQDDKEYLDLGLKIPGVDIKKGIVMTGGKLKGYLRVLSVFRADAEERLVLLRGYLEKFSSFEKDNILKKIYSLEEIKSDKFSRWQQDKNTARETDGGESAQEMAEKLFTGFVTQVHALKSASASLGALSFSKDAERLETDGKNWDALCICQKLGGFIESLEELIAAISQNTPQEPEAGKPAPSGETALAAPAAPPPAAQEGLLPLLHELREALAGQRSEAIDRLLEEAAEKTNDPATQKTLENISDQVLLAEFDEALETLKSLLQ